MVKGVGFGALLPQHMSHLGWAQGLRGPRGGHGEILVSEWKLGLCLREKRKAIMMHPRGAPHQDHPAATKRSCSKHRPELSVQKWGLELWYKMLQHSTVGP